MSKNEPLLRLIPSAEVTPRPDFRVAVIFDDTQRPDTTGRYVLDALRQWVHVDHFRPQEMARLAGEAWDLFLHIDDGLNYILPLNCYPRAFWVIDTHLALPLARERAPHYDWVFVAQKAGAQALRSDGLRNVWWLPLAADATGFRRPSDPPRWPWSFVGNTGGALFAEREAVLAACQAIEPGWAGTLAFTEMPDRYAESLAVVNPPVKDDVNMRFWEGIAAGAAVVTLDLPDLADLGFQDGVHYAGYASADAAPERLRAVLADPGAARRMGAAAQALARASHTYTHRVGALLETVWTVPGLAGNYYRQPRQELLNLVPTTARRILDIGCGGGALGAALKARQACAVTGVEINPRAVEIAADVLDQVIQAPVEEALAQLPQKAFDCIVCGDVLEHLVDPWTVLRQLTACLAPDPAACIVISVPNVAHWSVIGPLLFHGNWGYQAAGIQDATHLRWFTPSGVGRLLFAAGLEAVENQGIVLPFPDNWPPTFDPALQEWKAQLGGIYQILCVARPAKPTADEAISEGLEKNLQKA